MVKINWLFFRSLVSLVHYVTEIIDELALSLKLFQPCSILLSNIFSRIGIESCVII